LLTRGGAGGKTAAADESLFFLSTDNPVVVTAILVCTGVVYSVLTAR
jgi:hypothetical protein